MLFFHNPLNHYDWKLTIPEAIHTQLLKLIKEYLIVGGMPSAVVTWQNEKSLEKVNQIHFDLLATYRDDFSKFRGRLSTDRLDEVMLSIPRQLGKKRVLKQKSTTSFNTKIRYFQLK